MTQRVDGPDARGADVGIGLLHLDYFGDRRQSESRTGGTVSARWFARRFAAGSAHGRVSLGGHADVFFRSMGFGGAGGAAAFELEIADGVGTGSFFDAGANDDGIGGIGGGDAGEIGFGLRAELAYHVLDDETHRLRRPSASCCGSRSSAATPVGSHSQN